MSGMKNRVRKLTVYKRKLKDYEIIINRMKFDLIRNESFSK